MEQQLKPYFTAELRQRGSAYFHDDRIRIVDSSEAEASAIVEGANSYFCTIRMPSSRLLKELVLMVSCSCPYYGKAGACKHIWAFILELDSREWGKKIATAERIILEEDLSPINDPEAIESLMAKALARSNGALRREPSKASKHLSWDQFRRQISHQNDRIPILYSEIPSETAHGERRLFFVLDLGRQIDNHELLLRFYSRDILQDDRLGVFKAVSVHRQLDRSFVETQDQLLFEALRKQLDGFVEQSLRSQRSVIRAASAREFMQGFLLPPDRALGILSDLHREQRLFGLPAQAKKPDPRPLQVTNQLWSLEAQLLAHPEAHYQLDVFLSNGHRRLHPKDASFLGGARFLVEDNCLHPCSLSEQQRHDWVERLQGIPPVLIPCLDLDRFIGEYAQIPSAPPMHWPEESAWREEPDSASPLLRLTPSHTPCEWMGELVFQYRHGEVNLADSRSRWVIPAEKCIYLRDFNAESQWTTELCALAGVFQSQAPDMLEVGRIVRVALKFLPSVVEKLEDRGWMVEVENRRLRILRDMETVVHGTTDWLDLSITTKMDAKTYEIPSLLKKRKTGEHFIPLGSADCALLPETWVRRMEVLEESGEFHNGRIRLPSRQALFLDSVLGDLEVDDRSERLSAIKHKIKNFQALVPLDPSPAFQGTLRDYQREGLAWLEFLRDFGFGGCLADDMGLGKTVQVLALLQSFHQKCSVHPSLIVVPRSLVDNWMDEAARFCPDLKVKDFSKGLRNWAKASDADLILITYGTLRQDIEALRLQRFAYVVLDESQAIKNGSSQTAKASYLLQAQHRLAMSGTPIENHLGELRSLLRFLNPGMLDAGPWPKLLQKNSNLNDPHVKFLNQALKPLVLRRTKGEVLKDLPPKVEHTLAFELEGEQRQLYDELRDHYRRHLLPELQDDSWQKSPLNLIEALLRLRQAACHPALISADHAQVPSAKLEILIEKLQELQESGHKALIFSQFTSFLKIVGARLQEQGLAYEYLDGQTRDRSSRVARFQSQADIPFFLISLKAGGVGLNLTSADYCFILDPWWNPAVEAQAIDRAHRIRQKKTVFAYRLIAKDTVEEKIQQMQREKQDMAASLLEGDPSLLKNLDLKAIHSLFS